MDIQNRILNLSYGKDSIASIGAIKKLNWGLDRIVHVEIFATKTIPADLPYIVEFKKYADKKILDMTGIKVEHIRSPKTYEDIFYSMRKDRKTKKYEQMYGFPIRGGNWCNSDLKRKVLEKARFPSDIVYVGIAYDEPKRFKVLRGNITSPLVAARWTESDCMEWCKKHDLVSPVYSHTGRSGCWFCHNQRVSQLRELRHDYPELWQLMLKWDKDSPTCFTTNGITIHDFDRRFALEDNGSIPPGKRFMWKKLKGNKYEKN